MGGQYGIKETDEAIYAALVVGKFVIDRLKDGIQLDDAVAVGEKLLLDPAFKQIVADGISGIDKVPKEVGELDVQDILALANNIPKYVKAISTP